MHKPSLFPVNPEDDDREREQVTLPHTFNGSDLFSVRIGDGDTGQNEHGIHGAVRPGPV